MTRPAKRGCVGVIADDFTGATDIAGTLAAGGLRTVLGVGLPQATRDYGSPDALVVALKTRSIAPAEAVRQSLGALTCLRERGAEPVFFKYCSTFDSTPAGNIGPVADALLEALGAPLTVHCPAFPATGRRLFGGYLFVGDVLLSETGMRDHPITPMRDANLVRVLQAQTPSRVGRIDLSVVRRGRASLAQAITAAASAGLRHAIVDAVSDDDLRVICGAAFDAGLSLVSGASGIALGVGENFQGQGQGQGQGTVDDGCAADDRLADFRGISGPAAILAGSCSPMTRAQITYARERLPVFDLAERSFDEPRERVTEALAWADDALSERPILIVASDVPERVAENQRRYGAAEASARVEAVVAGIACGLVQRGVRRLVVAGGETSGAVVEALGVGALRIGPAIDPGVPWTATFDDLPIALALKSGNFGGEDFFLRAFTCLDAPAT